MIIIMVNGMSAFIPDPERAIQQTFYDFGLTAETLGWTMPGWSEGVSRFSLHASFPQQKQGKQQSLASPEEDIRIWRRLRHDLQAGVYTGEEVEAAAAWVPACRAHGLTAQDDRLEPVLEI